MTPEEGFSNLAEWLSTAGPSVTLALAGPSSAAEGLTYQSLNITNEVAKQFLVAATDFILDTAASIESGDAVLSPYDPGYKPDAHEIEFLELTEEADKAVFAFPVGASTPLIDPSLKFVDGVRAAITILEKDDQRVAVFRRFSRNKELLRSGNFLLRLVGHRFERLAEPTLQFDLGVDVIVTPNHVFSFNRFALEQVFRFRDMLRSMADQTISEIASRVPIANLDEFRKACLGDPNKLAKLRNIARRPYIGDISLDKLKEQIDRCKLSVKIVQENGTPKLLYERRDGWAILSLLDDAYLDSLMTGNLYEANSKRQL
jgi:hypothetical protein